MPTSRRALARSIALSLLVVSAAGCADVSGNSAGKTPGQARGGVAQSVPAPSPVASLPANVSKLTKTDVGEYLVTPRPGTTSETVQATIRTLVKMPGVQSATLNPAGKVDLVFAGGSTPAQHEAAVRQLSVLGEIEEGI